MIDQNYVKELFHYHKGNLYWEISKAARIKVGDLAGYKKYYPRIGKYRYYISVDTRQYLRSRLVYLYHYGHMPKIVDHVNTDTLDDNISNLREASKSQNAQNRKSPKNNTSGFKGVSWCKRSEVWVAQIMINNKKKHLGKSDTAEGAARLYDLGSLKYHGDFGQRNF